MPEIAERGRDVAHDFRRAQVAHQRLRAGELVVTEDGRTLPVKQGRRNGQVAGVREPAADVADMASQPECLLEHHNPAGRRAGGRGGHAGKRPGTLAQHHVERLRHQTGILSALAV